MSPRTTKKAKASDAPVANQARRAQVLAMGLVIEDPALHGREKVFRDRAQGGEAIAQLLRTLPLVEPLLLAIPAGGVPVAAEVARLLGAPLDVAVVSKLTLPWNTEAGYGAVAFDGTVLLHHDLIQTVSLSQAVVDTGIENTRRKVERRAQRLRKGKTPLLLRGKTAVLIDDGLASGFTMKAGVLACRNAGAQVIVAAVPTAHAGAIARVVNDVDYVVSPNVREGPTFAVAHAYEEWRDVPEAAAELYLERLAAPLG